MRANSSLVSVQLCPGQLELYLRGFDVFEEFLPLQFSILPEQSEPLLLETKRLHVDLSLDVA